MGHQMLGINVAENALKEEVKLLRKHTKKQRDIKRINGMRSFYVEFIRNEGYWFLFLLT